MLLFLLPAGVTTAAEKTAGERPRVGLVLSGGGARGLAHVGVLKVLEEYHIPVDMIAGTSAGSIIAGLYAMGLSADEIEDVILNIDWNEGFSDAPDRRYRSFLRKQDDLDMLTTLPAGISSKGLRMPKGLLQGQRLELLLKGITSGAELVEDFDQLPIPYRAIATNIENGDRVAIAKGDIVRAMHASMAIPGVYAPVEIDDMLLVDGGLSSNLPIEVVREMGADIIIAIDISTPLSTAKQLTSVLSIVGQVTSLLTQDTVEQELTLLTHSDTLITPDLRGYTSANFDKVPEIIAVGELAARNARDQLKRHSIDAASYQAYRQQKTRLTQQSPIIDDVVISTNSKLSQARLASYISIKPGERFDAEQLKQDITYLYGLGYFSSIAYELHKEDGATSLLVDIRKKDWGPNYLRAGFVISGNFNGDNQVNISTGILATEVNSLGAEWNTDIGFGNRAGLRSEFLQPIGANSPYFIAATGLLLRRNINLYKDGNKVQTARLAEQQLSLDFGRHFGTLAEVRVGITRGTGTAETITGTPVDADKSENAVVRLSLKYDSMDNVNFPHEGAYGQLYLSSSRTELGSDTNTDLAALSVYKAVQWGQHTLLGNIRYGDTLNNNPDLHKLFQLGGFMSLSGFSQDELSGPYSALATLSYYRTLNHYFIKSAEMPMYIGASIETGNTWQTRSQINVDSLIQAGSVFIGVNTYVGPLYIAYGFNSTGRQSSYLFLGRLF